MNCYLKRVTQRHKNVRTLKKLSSNSRGRSSSFTDLRRGTVAHFNVNFEQKAFFAESNKNIQTLSFYTVQYSIDTAMIFILGDHSLRFLTIEPSSPLSFANGCEMKSISEHCLLGLRVQWIPSTDSTRYHTL